MIEVLVNDVTQDGMRRVKVVSDAPLSAYPLTSPQMASHLKIAQQFGGSVRTWSDDLLGLHYLEVIWMCREAITIRCEGWKCAREMVLWKLASDERVSVAFRDALLVYLERFKRFPDYAFLRRLPKEIDNGFEMSDVSFMEAEWIPAGCVAICEGEHYGLEAMAL